MNQVVCDGCGKPLKGIDNKTVNKLRRCYQIENGTSIVVEVHAGTVEISKGDLCSDCVVKAVTEGKDIG